MPSGAVKKDLGLLLTRMDGRINITAQQFGIRRSNYRFVGTSEGSSDPTNLGYDALALVVPSLLFLEVSIIGRLSIAELLLLSCLPVLYHDARKNLYSRSVRTTLLLCILWLFGQIATDVLLGTPFDDYARGWSKIAFTLANLLGLIMLLGRSRRRMALFAAGLAIGGTLGYYFNPSIYSVAEPWKFGVGPPITWVVVLLSTWRYARGSRFQAAMLAAFGAVINLYFGHRSLGGVCFLTALWLIKRPDQGSDRTSLLRHLVLLLTLLGVGFSFLKAYEYSAKEGLLGDRAQQIVKWQSAGELGVMAGGRGALIASLQGIVESPLIGHGSWINGSELMSRATGILRQIGYETNSGFVGGDSQGALHSHVLGAWVEAGVLGAVFWIWVIVLGVRSLGRLYSREEPMIPLIAFAGLMLLWDISFSPYAGDHRLITPYYIALMINGHRLLLGNRLGSTTFSIKPMLLLKWS